MLFMHRLGAMCRSTLALSCLAKAFMIVTLSTSGCGSVEQPANPDGTGGTGMNSGSTASSSSSSGSTGSSAGAGGSDVRLPLEELDPADVARAAVFIGSCMPDDGISFNLKALYWHKGGQSWFDKTVRDRLTCLKGKTNGCKGAEECFGYHQDMTGPCETTCNDGVLTACQGTTKFQIDCKLGGLSCSVEARNCVPPVTPTCDVTTFQSRCDAGVPVVECENGLEVRMPTCTDYGLECGTLNSNEVACRGTGPVCETGTLKTRGDSVDYDRGIACEEQKLRACVNDGETVVDCGKLGKGFICQSGTSAYCGLATECVPGASATCEGTNVVFCNAGRIEKIDCAALGFTGCTDAFHGTCAPGPIN
jgi:hypothetical protein